MADAKRVFIIYADEENNPAHAQVVVERLASRALSTTSVNDTTVYSICRPW
jgi:hypothetical protein